MVALLTALSVALETLEQTCFKFAAAPRRRIAFTLAGTAINLAGMGVLLLLLRHAALGWVVPMLAATNLTVALVGAGFFGEAIGRRRWIGIVLITLGVALVGTGFTE